MGNIAKAKPDGTVKHRPIQDQRRNGVNDWVVLPERQVLPRPLDHARDLAVLAAEATGTQQVWTLLLDLADAFLGIPLHPDEYANNCTNLEEPVRRARDALDADEAECGTFLVWRVLGFGGRPNPLIYARVASLLCRTGQSLWRPSLASEGGSKEIAPGRMQLFVDDPAVALLGNRKEAIYDDMHQEPTSFDHMNFSGGVGGF